MTPQRWNPSAGRFVDSAPAPIRFAPEPITPDPICAPARSDMPTGRNQSEAGAQRERAHRTAQREIARREQARRKQERQRLREQYRAVPVDWPVRKKQEVAR